MKHTNEAILLELSDLIRMNQLIRSEVNLDGFIEWYDQLTQEEQGVLLTYLHIYAQEAGSIQKVLSAVYEATGIFPDHPLVNVILTFKGGYSQQNGMEAEWLRLLDSDQRFLALKFLVFLFGYAEGEVYRNETKESCNHWCHRDVTDPDVVEDLLHNPEFYRTSMKDDDRIKSRLGK